MQPPTLTVNAPLALPAFGDIEPARVLALDDLFAVVSDKYPVSPGHMLIIARRPAARFQELTGAEKARLMAWIDWTQQHLTSSLKPSPDAFNLGLNDGPAAGQTVPQLHFHVIPRYTGDVEDPRGGVRHVIPSKASYWEEKPITGAGFFSQFDSPACLPSARVWTGNDDTNRHHHSLVDLKNHFDLVLYWKMSRGATPHLVGCYRFDLLALQRAGYIRTEKSGKVRVRFVHGPDDQIYIQQSRQGAPCLLVGKFKGHP